MTTDRTVVAVRVCGVTKRGELAAAPRSCVDALVAVFSTGGYPGTAEPDDGPAVSEAGGANVGATPARVAIRRAVTSTVSWSPNVGTLSSTGCPSSNSDSRRGSASGTWWTRPGR